MLISSKYFRNLLISEYYLTIIKKLDIKISKCYINLWFVNRILLRRAGNKVLGEQIPDGLLSS